MLRKLISARMVLVNGSPTTELLQVEGKHINLKSQKPKRLGGISGRFRWVDRFVSLG